MKSYELKPTYENLLSTYINDSIGRNEDVFRFADILDSVDGDCSIALDGQWGSGKTFFVKQVKLLLDAGNEHVTILDNDDRNKIKSIWQSMNRKREFDYQPQLCVYYDAWENDSDDDPILSLVYSILTSLNIDEIPLENNNMFKKAAAVLELFSGRNWSAIVSAFKSNNPLDEIKKSKDVDKEITEFIDSLLVERGNRLVVFIDELDRCKPNYAVKLLERIKHYFSNDKVTFVFSVNMQELQHTIKKHYGSDFDAYRYLDRFFDLRITLPKANRKQFYDSIDFDNGNYTYDIVCDAVIDTLNLSLREAGRFLRFSKIAAYEPTHKQSDSMIFSFSDGKARLFSLLYILPVMIGLKICSGDKYQTFINGRDSEPLINVINKLDHFNFEEFLSSGETFDKNVQGKRAVTVADKFEEVYKALFFKHYSINDRYIEIGNMSFSNEIREFLLRTASLLSEYTNASED